MSAKRFAARSMMIVLLAVSLVASGCASLRPPIYETGGGAMQSNVVQWFPANELVEPYHPAPPKAPRPWAK